jgi:hypothetical protein
MVNKNLHMTHIEDNIIYNGVNGITTTINHIKNIREMFVNNNKLNITQKWDGSPSIFAGVDPSDGKFFVAKKSIFNKNPKVYKTFSEIENDTKGDLCEKLKIALSYLPELDIKGVLQGDLLYTKSDIEIVKINDIEYVTFHPNTIVYGIETNTETANDILKSEIGIVWHTEYKGDSFENMEASYHIDTSNIKSSKNVWSINAKFKLPNTLNISYKDIDKIKCDIENVEGLLSKELYKKLDNLHKNDSIPRLIEQYSNTLVRKGEFNDDVYSYINKLKSWIIEKYNNEIDKRKTERGKNTQRDKLNEIISILDDDNTNLANIFKIQRIVVSTKLNLINILDGLNPFNTFVKTHKGYELTGSEGYVIFNNLGSEAVKLVNRMEFSYNNFSANIIKGWEKTK